MATTPPIVHTSFVMGLLWLSFWSGSRVGGRFFFFSFGGRPAGRICAQGRCSHAPTLLGFSHVPRASQGPPEKKISLRLHGSLRTHPAGISGRVARSRVVGLSESLGYSVAVAVDRPGPPRPSKPGHGPPTPRTRLARELLRAGACACASGAREPLGSKQIERVGRGYTIFTVSRETLFWQITFLEYSIYYYITFSHGKDYI